MAAKRILDVTLALIGLVPAVPIMAIAAVCIMAESKGNPIFRQVRVGRGEKPFVLAKLRTMHIDTGDRPSHEVATSAITRTGAFLRKTKLDELPQIFAVLAGHMSFVGPRPCLPSQDRLIAARRSLGVDRLVPGITGVSQLAGLDMSRPEELAAMDATYLGKETVGFDLRVIARTALGSGMGDAARAARDDG